MIVGNNWWKGGRDRGKKKEKGKEEREKERKEKLGKKKENWGLEMAKHLHMVKMFINGQTFAHGENVYK